METNSEKTRRGRPRRFNPEMEAYVRSQYGDVKTDRGRQNILYRLDAIRQFMDREEFEWLGVMKSNMLASSPPLPIKWGILSELGRIVDEEERYQTALKICELKPSVTEGKRLIRMWRVGLPQADCLVLSDAIIRAVNGYIDSHECVSAQMIMTALENAADAFSEANSEIPEGNESKSDCEST